MRHIVMAGTAAALLIGCQPGVTAQPVGCGAVGLQHLVGQPAKVLQTMKFVGEVRIVRPGMAVTMDYRPDRLNIDIDATERIIRVHCT